ncbi:MAG: SPFH domain-containing protein [Clostridia bacterium]|nr:SPFH domain-containing protein [Clostridia bacterium]
MGFKSSKEVTVSRNDQYVMWRVDISDVAYNATLNVETGLMGMYIVNGQLRSMNPAGRSMINPKSEKKEGNKQELIGVSMDKTFDIPCGGGQVPFKDWEYDLEDVVGAHGECRLRILQPWVLYTTLGKADLTAEDLEEYVRPKLVELLRTELAVVLQQLDYLTVTTQLSRISEVLTEKFAAPLETMGLHVEEFSLKKIHFSEDYENARRAVIEQGKQKKQRKEEQREEARKQRAELDVLRELSDMSAKAAQAGQSNAPAPNAGNFCPGCGRTIEGKMLFCPSCGKKLS